MNSSGESARMTPRLAESASGFTTQGNLILPRAWRGSSWIENFSNQGMGRPAARINSRERNLSLQASTASGEL